MRWGRWGPGVCVVCGFSVLTAWCRCQCRKSMINSDTGSGDDESAMFKQINLRIQQKNARIENPHFCVGLWIPSEFRGRVRVRTPPPPKKYLPEIDFVVPDGRRNKLLHVSFGNCYILVLSKGWLLLPDTCSDFDEGANNFTKAWSPL